MSSVQDLFKYFNNINEFEQLLIDAKTGIDTTLDYTLASGDSLTTTQISEVKQGLALLINDYLIQKPDAFEGLFEDLADEIKLKSDAEINTYLTSHGETIDPTKSAQDTLIGSVKSTYELSLLNPSFFDSIKAINELESRVRTSADSLSYLENIKSTLDGLKTTADQATQRKRERMQIYTTGINHITQRINGIMKKLKGAFDR